MKYCDFNGCTSKISKGKYCDDHKRSKQSARRVQKKKEIYHHNNKAFYRSDAWKAMRAYVYERERGCCQSCGVFVFGRKAHVHHIVPIAKNETLKLEENNLMLLCPTCHVAIENEEKQQKVYASYFDKYLW
jgi:5-methylcytosine-specific restriction enzyme A